MSDCSMGGAPPPPPARPPPPLTHPGLVNAGPESPEGALMRRRAPAFLTAGPGLLRAVCGNSLCALKHARLTGIQS